MINTNKLKGLIAEKGYSQSGIAKQMNITPKTFYSKMKKGVFTNVEIEAFIKILDINNPLEIFFVN